MRCGCEMMCVCDETWCCLLPAPHRRAAALLRQHAVPLSAAQSAKCHLPALLPSSQRAPTLVASCLRGALPPVDLRAVCLVRAMLTGLGGFSEEKVAVCILGGCEDAKQGPSLMYGCALSRMGAASCCIRPGNPLGSWLSLNFERPEGSKKLGFSSLLAAQ